jgi:uncharacterized membrane protein
MNIIIYLGTLVVLAILDAVWLFSMGTNYKTWLGHLFAPKVNFIPVIVFYLIYALGVTFFVTSPAFKNGTSLWTLFATGALFGLVAYATYDLTNQATLRAWPTTVTLIDMAWGALLTGLTSVIVVSLISYFK